MATDRYDFSDSHACRRARTLTRTFDYLDDESVEIDLTGYTAQMQVRRAASLDADLLIDLTSSLSIPDPTSGQIVLSVAAADTEALQPGRYWYDLILVSGSTRLQVLEGVFDLVDVVTEAA